jgi:hypothetical protein
MPKRSCFCGGVVANQLNFCMVHRGVVVQNGKAALHECTDSHVLTGYTVSHGGALLLEGCCSDFSESPVHATDNFTLRASTCQFKNFMTADLQARGLLLQGPGDVVLKECNVIGVEQGTPQVALPTSFHETCTPALVAAHVCRFLARTTLHDTAEPL